ncbi:MAG: 30S ribosomal protein S17 [Candidatus Nomurabacteria bacterium]|jgi:small subunit ribosomal protein S17|nr:30S ribosomal protein S17 [Candidatus Nomurabacteria bacterium]
MARTLTGVVSSDLRDKTLTVVVTSRETHPIYRKQFTITRKYTAHDEKNVAKKGDFVQISESRPISKTKTWKLDKIIKKSEGEIILKDEVEKVEA